MSVIHRLMIRNYIKIAFRNILRHKAFSAINITGLTIGLTCSIFILLWVKHESSYDRFHKNAKDIYRLTATVSDFDVAVTPAPVAPELQATIPYIKNYVRVANFGPHFFEYGKKKFEEKYALHVDSTFLQVFSFPLLKGDPATALIRPDAVVLTENAAKKYFGSTDVLGKVLKWNTKENLQVTGVLKNIPSNSSLEFDFVMPMAAMVDKNWDLKNNNWSNYNFYSYLQFETDSKAMITDAEDRINKIYVEHVDQKTLKVDFSLQKLTDIHLHSGKLQADIVKHGNILYVNTFWIVAIFITAVACINFMNLATARSSRRAKEIGLRKVVGAGRKQLITQFLGESMLISFISLLLSVGLMLLLFPSFRNLAGKDITLNWTDGTLWIGLLIIALLTGLISGSYPALFLSRFQPVKVLKGNLKSTGGNLLLRNGLVVLQFVICIVLLVGTVVVYRQLNYIKDMNLGFDKSNLLYMPMTGEAWKKQDALKSMLLQNPLTANFAISSDLPLELVSGTIDVKWDGKDPNEQVIFPNMSVNEDFQKVLGLEMLAGRFFSRDFKGDSVNYVVNEKALKAMKINSPAEAIGKNFSLWERNKTTNGTIVGVVRDFNFKPVQQAIEPLVLYLNNWGGIVIVRTNGGNTEAAIKVLEDISIALNPAFPFSYGFLDQDLNNLYKGEQQMGSLFNVFAVLAIFISCLGLYGLSAFMAEQRTKEIGVRRVLGASVSNVVYLLSATFTRLVIISIIVAIPLAWMIVRYWLNTFAYRTDIGWLVFVAAGLIALVIGWLTISYESLKAAMANPVRSLKSE